MWEKNVYQRLVLVAVLLVLALLVLRNPAETLKPGQDIAGGVSLIFEIEEAEDSPYGASTAERMKSLLMDRIDPQGVSDVVIRAVGDNRLEVRMPLPPEDTAELQQAYADALERFEQENLQRSEVEEMLRMEEPQRSARLTALADGRQDREAALKYAIERFEAFKQARQAADAGPANAPATQPAVSQETLDRELRLAEELYLDAVDAALATNVSVRELQRVLDLEYGTPAYMNALRDLKARYPNLEDEIQDVAEAHRTWRSQAGALSSAADLKRLIKGAGKLEFRILAEPSPENIAAFDYYREELQRIGPRAEAGGEYRWFKIDNPLAFLNIDSPSALDQLDPRAIRGMVVDKYNDEWYVLAHTAPEQTMLKAKSGPQWKLTQAFADRGRDGRLEVRFQLNPIGGSLFYELTNRNVNRQLAILVDDVAYSSANINEAISTSGSISGNFSREKVDYLVQTMEAGSLPARLKETPVSERTIGSTLGETNLRYAFRAGVIGLIAVALIMVGYYLVAGAIANVALILNMVFVLAAMALLEARITLAGIAGLILTVGMTVDANVLIFERMREEKLRGSSLRMIIKNGYDKAFSTIIDANITTLLTCVIIAFIGSDEIKGFGITLGWGVVLSLFTALFVTRTIFALLVRNNWIRDINMFQLIRSPNIDWYGMRKIFVPISATLIILGLIALYTRGWKDLLDVEFLGGVSAELELTTADIPEAEGRPIDRWLAGQLTAIGQSISTAGEALDQAEVVPVPGRTNTFQVTAPGADSRLLAAMIGEPLEDAGLLARGGIDTHGSERAVNLTVESDVDRQKLENVIRGLAPVVAQQGEDIARASIGSVLDYDDEADKGRFWNIVSTVTNKQLVQYALVGAAGDYLKIQPQVAYVFRGDADLPYPVTERQLERVVPGIEKRIDVTDYLGGAAIYLDELDPPQSVDSLTTRLENMRLQPGYQDYPYRPVRVVGVQPSEDKFESVIVLVADPQIRYSENPAAWARALAGPELELVRSTLDTEQSLRRVTQFKPQIANDSKTQASVALVLSWLMIIGYLWIRFGRPAFGLAGVAALIHDVLIALAFVGFSGVLGGPGHPIGEALLIQDFKIDMTIVAAFLTIIGYSINDSIVIFDRIREMRGRLGIVTSDTINGAINQCISRTVITSVTTLIVLLVMYIFGGSSIRGFNYCMIIGILTGTYSSVAVAAPLLMLRSEGKPTPVKSTEPATA